MNKPTLTLMIGLPRSGKSTMARQAGYPIVSPDAIRIALHGQAFRAESEPMVWAIAKIMVAALFEAGHERVTVDACNITHKRRAGLARQAMEYNLLADFYGKEECLKRAQEEGRAELLPVIERMAAEFEKPTSEDMN